VSGRRSGRPARRAILRWAWRLFRRDWRQQALILGLLSVAVAAAVAVATLASSAATGSDGEFGHAEGLGRLDARSPAAASAAVASARRRFGTVEVVRHGKVAVPGAVDRLDVRDQDPAAPLGRPTLALRAGRYPRTTGEVALTRKAAELLDADIGEHVRLGRVERTVVGRVENPGDLHDTFALVAPDDPVAADSVTLLIGSIDRPPGSSTAAAPGGPSVDFPIEVRPDDRAAASSAVLVATTLAMALVALIAAAGFLVVAQRRQRQLGLLAALGATERHLRLAVLADGVLVGLVAAAVGGATGVVGWLAAAPALETAIGHRVDRLALPWVLIAECLGLAVISATAAAWWPARTMARLPVMAALARRPSRPLPVHRSSAVALLLLAGGVGAISASRPTGDVRPLLLIGGTIALVLGVVLAAPLAVRGLALPARRLPFSARLALRDLVRHQGRAAAAVAAITLALGITVATSALAKANEDRADEGNLSDRQVLVRVGGLDDRPSAHLDDETRARLDAAAERVRAAIGGADSLPLDIPLDPAASVTNNDTVGVVERIGPNGFRWVTQPYVATPEILDRFDIDPASIDPGADLLTSRRGPLVVFSPASRREPTTQVQQLPLSRYSDAPNSLVTEHLMQERGWVAARWGWLLEAPKALTADQRVAAREAAAATGLRIETRDRQDDLATLRTVATAVGALLALAIVAMTIGLLRGESVADLRTLTATGAGPGTRRALTASTAGTLAVLGITLGGGGAYVALVAAYRGDLGRLAPLPVPHLLALAVGLPLVAAAAGWLLAGREPAGFARQSLE
jgi:putative ABC transport system permease protein